MLRQYFFAVDEHRETGWALILNFGANLSNRLFGWQFFCLRRQNLSNIEFKTAVDKNLFVYRVDLLLWVIAPAGQRGLIISGLNEPVLPSDEFNGSNQLLHIFVGNVDVGRHDYTLLGALFNVDAHGVEDVWELVAR